MNGEFAGTLKEAQMSNGTEPWEFGNTGGAGEPDPFLTYDPVQKGTGLVKDKGPRIDTRRFAEPLKIEEEDNIPCDCGTCQEEKPHYTFPNHATGPVKTVVFDDHSMYCTAKQEVEEKGLAPDQDARPSLTEFERALKNLLNKYSMENASSTPDHILAEYMHACLISFNIATRAREHWYGRRVF